MRYLITGHTGFKGSWLSAMLKIQGHEVCGVSLSPEKKSLFNEAKISKYINREYILDIRNGKELTKAFKEIQPDVLIHLAAQPLVRQSYKDPVGTYETNVIGTINTLEATKYLESLKASLIITTDKVYKNIKQSAGYVENDALGGFDPYSASKAAADIATQSWRSSFGTYPISIARAGNVIGGGDWSKDRLIPDLVSAIESRERLIIRNPKSIRPWQHVLDCLNGYLLLVNKQLSDKVQGEWNFGPSESDLKNVQDVIGKFANTWGKEINYEEQKSELEEDELLVLNSEKSRTMLNWKDKLNFDETIKWTVDWYKSINRKSALIDQIEKYFLL